MALTTAADRQNLANTTHTKARVPLAASARPFQGSAIGIKTDGYARPLTAGDPLLGFAERTVDLEDVVATDGGQSATIDRGLQVAVLPVTGVTRADIGKRRLVYASDDGTFGFTAPGNTLVGPVIGLEGTNLAAVLVIPAHHLPAAPGAAGLRDLADAPATLTTADCDKVLRLAPTAARTITLPPAADCGGRFLTVVKNNALANTITLDGNGAETIDGAATLDLASGTVRDRVTLVSDGTGWSRIA